MNGFQSAIKFDDESVSCCIDFPAFEAIEQRANDRAMLLQELVPERFIFVHELAEADHVGKHNRCQPS
jgi:hypothetical protein